VENFPETCGEPVENLWRRCKLAVETLWKDWGKFEALIRIAKVRNVKVSGF